MTKKIFSGTIMVALIIMICCVGLIMGVMYDYLGTQIYLDLENQSQLVQEGMKLSGQEYLDIMKNNPDLTVRVTLIDANGDVLYDTHADETMMENHVDREEIQEAILDGEGRAVRESETMASETRYYALRLDNGQILRVSTDHYSQLGLILDNMGMIVVIVAVLFALAMAISHMVTRHIVKPINDIDLNHPAVGDSYDELEPLLHRINQQNNKIHRQMEKLRRRQEEFNIITESMSEGLLILDQSKEILTHNQSALQILGAEKKSWTGVNALQLNRSEPFRTSVEQALKGIHCRHNLTLGGETYEILASPVMNKDKINGAVLIIMNVTEREVGERVRREFTSNVSHELKTPLTSIYGVSDMLASGIVRPEDVGQFAVTIKEESSRLISLIDDIMQLSRLDENQVPQQKEDVDLYLLAGDVLTRLQRKADAAGVTLQLDGSSTMVHGIDYILDEIIYNLCENAIKYNRQGGKVTVFAGYERGTSVLRVTDTGIGIPKEDLERVFERFYRVDKSHNRRIPGTGLGLSIVKHGVAYHGGTINLESSEGVGTTVTVKF
ncbi:MAG: PAS domain-containing protein [Firmicutes bacterium]|nr:PAS domain-containing protein [Bacillota bacterium]